MTAHRVYVAKLQVETNFRLCWWIALFPLPFDNEFVDPGLFACQVLVLHDDPALSDTAKINSAYINTVIINSICNKAREKIEHSA